MDKINSTLRQKKTLNIGAIKIKDMDVALCTVLFFDPTGGIPNTMLTAVRYCIIVYLFLKYSDSLSRIKGTSLCMSIVSVILLVSTYINTGSPTRAISGCMFCVQIITFMLVAISATERISYRGTLKIIIGTFAVLLFVNDFLMLVLPYDYSDSDTLYLLGNKFIVSYAHALFSGMVFAMIPNKPWRARVICLACALMANISGSATGTVVVLTVLGLSFLPKPAQKILSNPLTVISAIAILNILIWGSTNLLQNPYVQDFVTKVLGRSSDLTGRQRLYDATFSIVQQKPLWGWGYLTDIYRELFGYGNAQNGLFHLVTQCGIVGSLFYFLGLYVAMRKSHLEEVTDVSLFGLYGYLLAMIVGSAVEINLSTQFAFGVALVCAATHAKKGA